MAGIELDGANQKVVLDSDGDTYLEAATDDTIKVYVAGAHDATISANAINVLSGTTLTVDSGATITNSGTANGFGTDPDGAQVFNESSADVDFRIESNGNDHMLFVDGGNDHVMIGTSSDLGGVFGVNGDQENQGNFKIKHTGDAPRILRLDANRGAGGDSIGDIEFMWNGNINAKISGIAGPDTTNKDDAHLDFFTRTSGASIANRMRINTSGNVLVNLTDTIFGGNMLQIYGGTDAEVVAIQVETNGKKGIQFANASGTDVGNIVVAASSTAYNTSSDYRLKENVNYNFDATTRLKQLKPARFNWIADNTNTLIDGFLAHEVSSIVPEAVTGTKDELEIYKYYDEIPAEKSLGDNKIDKDGNTIAKHQSIDNSKLIPLLVKTIQELEARIKTLEDA